MKTCSIDGCNGAVLAKGYCSKHYQRWRSGTPLDRRDKAPNGAPLAFLASLIGTEEQGCVKWPYGTTGGGRGSMFVGDNWINADRQICIMAHGEPPLPDLETAHSCGNGHLACVNPNHVRWDTRAGNHADKRQHGTHRQGSAITHLAKLNEDAVRSIVVRLAANETCASIAKSYGVTGGCIERIKNGTSWRHVTCSAPSSPS
jgi:hypothetical protein